MLSPPPPRRISSTIVQKFKIPMSKLERTIVNFLIFDFRGVIILFWAAGMKKKKKADKLILIHN